MPVLTAELRQEADRIKARYPDPRSAMMPLLYLVQSVEGHVSRDGMREVGELLGLTTAEVEAVATFYTMYRFRPAGRYVLAICTNVSCALLGAKHLYEKAEALLGPGAHDMTDDGAITLHEEECLGACEQAPLVQVNWLNYAEMTEGALVNLIDQLRAGSPPPSSQGVVPPDLKTTCRILAGLGTPDDWHVGNGARVGPGAGAGALSRSRSDAEPHEEQTEQPDIAPGRREERADGS